MYEIVYHHTRILGILLVSTMLAGNFAYGQAEVKIDSLKQLIHARKGAEKIAPTIAMVRIYGTFDNNEALKYALQASEISNEFGDTINYVTSTRMVAQLYNRLWQYKNAETILSKLLPIAKRHKLNNELKIIHAQLAISYTFEASYDKALKANFDALALREADNELAEVSGLLNNIGLVYFKIANYQKALEFYNNSIAVKKSIKTNYDFDRTLINIGLCYNALHDYEKALKYFEEGFEVCGDNCSNDILVEGKFGQGVSHFSLKKYQEAEQYFAQSLEIAERIGYVRFQAEDLLNIATIHRIQKKYDNVANLLAEAERISVKNGYSQVLIDVFNEFAKLYNDQKDFSKALLYQQKYSNLHDSIYSADLIDNLAKIQTDYAQRENIKTIATKEEEIKRQRTLTLAIVVIAVLAAALVFVLFRSNQTKKRVNAALSQAKGIIEEQNKLLTSSNIFLNKELEERNIDLEKANESLHKVNDELDNFIYKTSHDIRGPLASLKGMCNVALIDVQDPVALDYLQKLDVTADKMNTILTRLSIVNQINNSVVGYEQINFQEIVDDLLMIEKKKGMPPDFVIINDIGPGINFSSDKEFIRIILENLIDNAIKFYDDSKEQQPFVKVSIRQVKDNIVISVIDNGIGLLKVDPATIFHMFSRASERSQTGGIGLYITKTAVEKLGGSIDLRTTPESYTEFLIKLPLSPSKVLV